MARLQIPLRHIDIVAHTWKYGKAAEHARSPHWLEPWRQEPLPPWWVKHANQPKPPPLSLTAEELALVDGVVRQLHRVLAHTLDRSIDLFLSWDRDNSGKLDRREFRHAMAGIGVVASRTAVDLTFETFDTDRGGNIDYRELHRQIRRTLKAPSFRETWRPGMPPPLAELPAASCSSAAVHAARNLRPEVAAAGPIAKYNQASKPPQPAPMPSRRPQTAPAWQMSPRAQALLVPSRAELAGKRGESPRLTTRSLRLGDMWY